MATIKLNNKDIHRIIRECVKRLLSEDMRGFDSTGSVEGKDQVLKEYDVISFAYKFYTLWHVIERKYDISYVFRKNISFSEEKTKALYPDLEFKEGLRGKRQSFTISKMSGVEGSSDTDMGYLNHPSVKEGQPVSFDRFLVKSVSMKMSKYGKPYTSISGEDLDGAIYYNLIINIFDNISSVSIPKEGDILRVNGEIGFLNHSEGDIYLNNCKYEILDAVRSQGKGSAEKVNGKMAVKSIVMAKIDRAGRLEKPGVIIFTDEDGNEFYAESVGSEFRTGKAVKKIDTSGMNVGDIYNVAGTVKDVNGYNKLLRIKMSLIEKNDEAPEESNERPEIRFIRLDEEYHKGKTVEGAKSYQMKKEDLPNFFRHLINMKEKYDAVLEAHGFGLELKYHTMENTFVVTNENKNVSDVSELEDIFKASMEAVTFDKKYRRDFKMYFAVVIPQTKEKMNYRLNFYFKN